MVKYLKVVILIGIVIIACSLLLFNNPKCTNKIKHINISQCVYDFSVYDIDASVLENPKMVTMTCEIKNKSILSGVDNILPSLEYTGENDVLPKQIVNNGEEYSLSLKPLGKSVHRFNFVVDQKQYSEEELIDFLADVKVSLTGYTYSFGDLFKSDNLYNNKPVVVSDRNIGCTVDIGSLN